jgi:hypothetical protein
MKHVILILCAVVFLLPLGPASPQPEPAPDPTQSDVFDEFANNYRALLAESWSEMAAIEFESDHDQLEWINQRNTAAREASWKPVHDLAAESVKQGPEFAARFAHGLKERTLGR